MTKAVAKSFDYIRRPLKAEKLEIKMNSKIVKIARRAGSTIHLRNLNSLAEHIHADQSVLLNFHASWCRSSTELSPIVG